MIKKCYFCETIHNVETHHIDTERRNNNGENLVSLCGKCHSRLHRAIYPQWKKGIVIRMVNFSKSEKTFTYNDVAKVVKLSKQRISRIVGSKKSHSKFLDKTRGQYFTPNDFEKIKKMLKVGISLKKCAERWGIPYSTLYRIMKKNR